MDVTLEKVFAEVGRLHIQVQTLLEENARLNQLVESLKPKDTKQDG